MTKEVYVSPKAFTADGKASVRWSNTGIPSKEYRGEGRGDSKATAKSGNKKFSLNSDAKSFARRQAIRMGEGTHLVVYVTNGIAKQYCVSRGKLISMK